MTSGPSRDLDAVFHVEGDTVVPTELARGPWDEHAQHGGAVSSLLAGLLERIDRGPADFTARLTVELMRAIPLAPLQFATRTLRPGRKLELVEASLSHEGVEVARATQLRLRTIEGGFDGRWPEHRYEPIPPRGEIWEFPHMVDRTSGFWRAVELSRVAGEWGTAGRAVVWFRLAVPIIAGEEPSALQRVTAAADFTNGMGSGVERERFAGINPDLTIALHRMPAGEWVALDGITFPERSGVGEAESVLHDESGRIGRAVCTVLMQERPHPLIGSGNPADSGSTDPD